MDSKVEMDFRSGVLKCIDSGLDVLGPASKQVVYHYLAQRQLSRERIPDEPWKFTEALKSLFGRGEEILERTIVMEIKRTLGLASSGEMLVEILAAARLSKGTTGQPRTIRGEKHGSQRIVKTETG